MTVIRANTFLRLLLQTAITFAVLMFALCFTPSPMRLADIIGTR